MLGWLQRGCRWRWRGLEHPQRAKAERIRWREVELMERFLMWNDRFLWRWWNDGRWCDWRCSRASDRSFISAEFRAAILEPNLNSRLRQAYFLRQLFANEGVWNNFVISWRNHLRFDPYLGNASAQKSSPAPWAATKWMWFDFVLASCQTMYRRRALGLEGWWTTRNQL